MFIYKLYYINITFPVRVIVENIIPRNVIINQGAAYWRCASALRIDVAHQVTALIFYNITCCYGKYVAVFAIAVATGDIINCYMTGENPVS